MKNNVIHREKYIESIIANGIKYSADKNRKITLIDNGVVDITELEVNPNGYSVNKGVRLFNAEMVNYSEMVMHVVNSEIMLNDEAADDDYILRRVRKTILYKDSGATVSGEPVYERFYGFEIFVPFEDCDVTIIRDGNKSFSAVMENILEYVDNRPWLRFEYEKL